MRTFCTGLETVFIPSNITNHTTWNITSKWMPIIKKPSAHPFLGQILGTTLVHIDNSCIKACSIFSSRFVELYNITDKPLPTNLIFLYPGNLRGVEIDRFSFSPEAHTLFIRFNLTTGAEGVFQYNFTGEVRPRKFLL